MNVQKMCIKLAAAAGTAALVFALGGCSHAASTTATNDVSEVRTQNQPTGTTAAVMSGPAQVDSTGAVYSSSAAGGAGNAANVGTNTNVQVKPEAPSSSVAYTEPAPAPTPAPAPVVVETPAPAPVVVETPAPAPVITEPTPMTSSTTETHHRRMRKD